MSGELLTLEICRQFGWTYQEYQTQPTWFIDLAVEKMKIDTLKAKHAEGT